MGLVNWQRVRDGTAAIAMPQRIAMAANSSILPVVRPPEYPISLEYYPVVATEAHFTGVKSIPGI